MKNLLLIGVMAASMFFTAAVYAQTVTGTVTDATDGSPLPGVSVLIKGTATGTATDVDGNYSINVDGEETVLIFSYLGYQTTEERVGNRSAINVGLSEDAAELSEVVVTALGIERNVKALQYSVTNVGGENLMEARENNLANQLAGRVAGVNVSNVASGPAGSSRVIIRGNTSLQGNNQPLYVIDGIPMDNTNFGQAGMWGGVDQGDGMSSINPDDIESISVLKGASAAALYGARAANGVINIKTKRGEARRGIGVEFNSNFVFERINNQTDLQREFGSGRFQGDPETGTSVRPRTTQQGYDWGTQAWGERLDGGDVVHFDGVTRPYSYAGDNWNRFYETGTAWTNSISLSGGGENQTFRFNVTDLRSDAVVPNSGFDRFNMSLSTNGKFGNRLTFDAKVLYSQETARNRPSLSDSPNNAFQSIFALPPDVNVLDGRGDPNNLGSIPVGTDPTLLNVWGFEEREEYLMVNNPWGQNPYWATYQVSRGDVRDRIITSGSLRYDITDHLYISGRAGMDWFTRRFHDLIPQGTGHTRGGTLTEGENRVREINLEAMLGYTREFGDFGVNAFVGSNRMRRNNETISANGQGFNVPFFHAINNTVTRNFGYSYSGLGINSIFGSAEFSYKNYLFLTATARKDWFSVLDPSINNITYPSLGGSFVFSDAFEGLPIWLSFGKLRASWAQVGSATVAPYQISNVYSLLGAPAINFDGNQVPMASFANAQNNAGTIPNIGLIPLTSTETELGFDVRLFQNRLGVDLTYYHQRSTNDQLNAQVSRASGFGSTLVNLGEMENRGVEVLLTGSPITGRALNWDISLNIARNRNRVMSLIEGNDILNIEEPRTQTVFVQHRTGYPFGVIAGWVQAKTPDGIPIFEPNGAPVQSSQMEVIGNGVPDWTGGINNTLSFKGFTMSALIDFRIGGDLYSGTNLRLTQWGLHKQTLQGREGEEPLTVSGVVQAGSDAEGNPVYEEFNKTLTPGEAQNYWNQMGNRVQDHFIYDGSFAKLRQVTFGYNFPASLLGRMPFQSLHLSFVGRNLSILWKNVENIDPEANYTSGNAQGLDYFGMPQTRTFGFNLRATF
ncbi:SusC/RagA family TonB-linked outer membrane protein [Negadavirga shengliensis]|uniref:SusC/RagA family TonB-linked outer membrane protein n=1 Tax=Negadavirga shengliensis TaxID=1389218 RepID=A0ABV9T6J5_9BACT